MTWACIWSYFVCIWLTLSPEKRTSGKKKLASRLVTDYNSSPENDRDERSPKKKKKHRNEEPGE